MHKYHNNQLEYAIAGRPRLSREYIQERLRECEQKDDHRRRLKRLLHAYIEMQPPRPQVVADIAADLVALELGIDMPAVGRMNENEMQDDPNKLGYAPTRNENLIIIRMDVCACTIARTVAHETRHRWQIDTGRFLDMLGKGTSEPDAEQFASEFVRKHLVGHRCPCGTIIYPKMN
jgi:hypothetical protein